MLGVENDHQVFGGEDWWVLNLLKLQYYIKERFWKPPVSKLQLFFAFFLRSSDDIPSEYICSATARNHIGQSVKHKTYREVVSGKG